jgi:S-adenosylhomocysteine hydrolase
VVSLLRCDGEMRGMKSLCAGSGLIVAGFGDFRRALNARIDDIEPKQTSSNLE